MWYQTSFVKSLFFINFFKILVISLFRNLLMFLSWTRVSCFSSKEFYSYTPSFILRSLEQLLNWRRNFHEIIYISKDRFFLVGKTTVESISSAKFITMHAWSHMHDGYLIDWIIHQNAPWRKHWKGALNWVQRLTHWHKFQVTCPYPVR